MAKSIICACAPAIEPALESLGLALPFRTLDESAPHEDILRQPPILASIPELNDTPGGPNYAEVDLQTLLNYWQSVHESTSKYLSQLTEEELRRVVDLDPRGVVGQQ